MGQSHSRPACSGSADIRILNVGFNYKELIMSTIAEWREEITLGVSSDGHTSSELADALGVAPRTMRRKLRAGVASGRFVLGKAIRTNRDGANQPVTVYQIAGA